MTQNLPSVRRPQADGHSSTGVVAKPHHSLDDVVRDLACERQSGMPRDFHNKRRDLLAEIEALRARRGGQR
jgi:hypothetical protein